MDEKPSYSYRDPFSPHRKSDVDFKDVFGGPPSRRSSVYERPPLRTDSGDYARSSRGSRDELMHTTRHWSGSGGEKPAFGEGSNSSSGRRRIFGDDFFTDIFPGSDSSSSTPKREVFNSNPGSGVLSPNRPVQARHEGGSGGGGGGSSLPAQVSLSMKISHDTVSETNSYPSSPNSTTNLKSNNHSQYLRPNSSSRLRSQNSSEIHANTIAQFHFSFYKWAGKGATIKFPKEEEGRGTGLSVAEIVIQGIDLLSDNEEDEMSVETDLTEESGNNTQGESKFRVKNLAEFLMNEKVKNQENLQMEEEKDSKNSKKSESSISSEDKITGRKVKGKLVREFIKRFKSDKSPKQKIKNENRDQKRRKDSYENQDQNQNQFVNIDSSFSLQDEEKEEKPKSVKMSIDDAFFFASSHMGEEVKENIEAKSEEIRTEQKNKISEPDTNNEAQNNEESHFDDFEACLVEEYIEDPNQNNEAEDQIKISESKIRNWSKGKETNIRSLLSTLQYVLWDKSGWKPVPLVDIIEGPAVKKTYQRALLCLHPDKLQQRGAAPHQKYIAEKVFDILQEAWNQFSMMS